MAQEDKRKLINRINENRNRLAASLFPGIRYQASRMMKVQWNETLEYISQILLQRCKSSSYCLQVEDTGLGGKIRGVYSTHTGFKNETYLSFSAIDKVFNGIITSGFKSFQKRIKELEFKLDVQADHVQLEKLTDNKFYYGTVFTDQNLYRMGCAISIMLNINETNKSQAKFQCALQYKYNEDLSFKIGRSCSECNLEGLVCSTDYPNLCETLQIEESSKYLTIILIFTIGGSVFVLIVSFSYYFIRRRKQQTHLPNQRIMNNLNNL